MNKETSKIWKDYLTWLLKEFGIDSKGYKKLFTMLHNMEYTENDPHRRSDALRNRVTFFNKRGFEGELRHVFDDIPCSIMEFLVSFACRLNWEYIGDHTAQRCFNTYLRNLGLYWLGDEVFKEDKNVAEYVNYVTNRWMNHDFLYNGIGGLFPIKHPKRSQIDLGEWDQMQSYMMETDHPYPTDAFLN